MGTEESKLFVWRGTIERENKHTFRGFDKWIQEILQVGGCSWQVEPGACPYCGGACESKIEEWEGNITKAHLERHDTCLTCGFWCQIVDNTTKYTGQITEAKASTLKKFDINSSELGLDELASHLRRRFSDVYSLAPRRFEELVADVYRNLGYAVKLTQQSRDGGFDMVLLEDSSGEQILIECKRYAPGRKVSVEIVRQLLGVQLIQGVRRAKVVTTSCFTGPASSVSSELNSGESGFSLDLVDGDRLLRNLDVYNTSLPPLHLLEGWKRR